MNLNRIAQASNKNHLLYGLTILKTMTTTIKVPTCRCSAQTGHNAQTLSMPAAELARASLAPATIRAYRSALYAWDTFRNDRAENDTLISPVRAP